MSHPFAADLADLVACKLMPLPNLPAPALVDLSGDAPSFLFCGVELLAALRRTPRAVVRARRSQHARWALLRHRLLASGRVEVDFFAWRNEANQDARWEKSDLELAAIHWQREEHVQPTAARYHSRAGFNTSFTPIIARTGGDAL